MPRIVDHSLQDFIAATVSAISPACRTGSLEVCCFSLSLVFVLFFSSLEFTGAVYGALRAERVWKGRAGAASSTSGCASSPRLFGATVSFTLMTPVVFISLYVRNYLVCPLCPIENRTRGGETGKVLWAIIVVSCLCKCSFYLLFR